jgi:hypothetical protein
MGSEAIAGVGATAIGSLFLLISIFYSRNDEWRLRAAESRHLEHRFSPAIRKGEMTVEEWNKRFADQQRRLTNRVAIPFGVFFIVLGLYLLVQGLVSG